MEIESERDASLLSTFKDATKYMQKTGLSQTCAMPVRTMHVYFLGLRAEYQRKSITPEHEL